jgi:hypothetical protein
LQDKDIGVEFTTSCDGSLDVTQVDIGKQFTLAGDTGAFQLSGDHRRKSVLSPDRVPYNVTATGVQNPDVVRGRNGRTAHL